ncbi:MAG: hypothetical protein QNK04_32440 [Myxococcota bacterium]|nr:hypothetical protein [Myxococcota bacterium]
MGFPNRIQNLVLALGLTLLATEASALRWGDWQVSCVGMGQARYSAVLWDIPWGWSWENTCRQTGATIGGRSYARPNACVNTGSNIWGEFLVPDASCNPHWGEFRDDGCVEGAGFSGLRQYSAILWDIPPGVSWEDACSQTGATIAGVDHPRPAVCVASNLSWLGDVVGMVAGAAVGAVTVNPVAGAGAGVALSTAILAGDELSGGFGAMNMWGSFYAVDATCGPLGGGSETIDPAPPPALSRTAMRCQRVIGLQVGRLANAVQRKHARCLAREASGGVCDTAQRDAVVERVVARTEQVLDRACTDAGYDELGFGDDGVAARERLIESAHAAAESLVRASHPLGFPSKPAP